MGHAGGAGLPGSAAVYALPAAPAASPPPQPRPLRWFGDDGDNDDGSTISGPLTMRPVAVVALPTGSLRALAFGWELGQQVNKTCVRAHGSRNGRGPYAAVGPNAASSVGVAKKRQNGGAGGRGALAVGSRIWGRDRDTALLCLAGDKGLPITWTRIDASGSGGGFGDAVSGSGVLCPAAPDDLFSLAFFPPDWFCAALPQRLKEPARSGQPPSSDVALAGALSRVPPPVLAGGRSGRVYLLHGGRCRLLGVVCGGDGDGDCNSDGNRSKGAKGPRQQGGRAGKGSWKSGGKGGLKNEARRPDSGRRRGESVGSGSGRWGSGRWDGGGWDGGGSDRGGDGAPSSGAYGGVPGCWDAPVTRLDALVCTGGLTVVGFGPGTGRDAVVIDLAPALAAAWNSIMANDDSGGVCVGGGSGGGGKVASAGACQAAPTTARRLVALRSFPGSGASGFSVDSDAATVAVPVAAPDPVARGAAVRVSCAVSGAVLAESLGACAGPGHHPPHPPFASHFQQPQARAVAAPPLRLAPHPQHPQQRNGPSLRPAGSFHSSDGRYGNPFLFSASESCGAAATSRPRCNDATPTREWWGAAWWGLRSSGPGHSDGGAAATLVQVRCAGLHGPW